MRRSAVASFVATALSLTITGAAHAGQVEIEYEISGTSTVVATSGTMTLSFPATDVDTLIPGTGSFATFQLSGSGLLGSFFVAGEFTLLSPFTGAADYTGQLAGGPGQLRVASVNCLPFPNCMTFSSTAPVYGLAAEGGGGSFKSGGGSTLLSWTGQEVQRTFTPEPRGAWGSSAAAIALAALHWRRRKRGAHRPVR